MVPTVSQQLAAIRHTIAKTIMPAIDPGASFAQEQAGLVLASLDWALDVVESEHRYELVEQAEYRELLGALLALDDTVVTPDARQAIESTLTPAPDLATIRAANVELKRQVERAFRALTAGGNSGRTQDARRLVTGVARSQAKRESAWARMTGFTTPDGAIAEVLAAQATA